MKSILGGTPNVEPVPLDTDSILDDNNNFNEDSSHNDEGESGLMIMVMQLYRLCQTQQPMIQIVKLMISKWKILMQQNHHG